MRYWLTVHWPSPTHDLHRDVYFPDGREAPGRRIGVGDQILIYESKTGPAEIILEADRERRIKGRSDGRKGIVTIGTILSPVTNSGLPQSVYEGGRKIWWKWRAQTGRHNDGGFVPHLHICEVLGYSPNYSFRGFGEQRSGLKELTIDQFAQLASAFNQEKSVAFKHPSNLPTKYPGGEGPEHKALKELVAAQPSIVLEEEGLMHVGTEVLLPSGDRIDVLLRDRFGRYVAVEVEVTQGPMQLDGLCQAVKYRYLACIVHQVDFEASRSVLVAYDIDKSLEPIAKRYRVQLCRADRGVIARAAATANADTSQRIEELSN